MRKSVKKMSGPALLAACCELDELVLHQAAPERGDTPGFQRGNLEDPGHGSWLSLLDRPIVPHN